MSVSLPPLVPVVRARGSHREAGRQIGAACAGAVERAADIRSRLARSNVARTAKEQLALAARYRAVTEEELPWAAEELDGVAEGAGVDPLAVFAASVEEIWAPSAPSPPAESAGPAALRPVGRGRCTDLVAVPPASADGHVLVAHTNDESPEDEEWVSAVEWQVTGDPVVFSIGVGPWISVGFNSAGLSLTGNELTPNDERIGIPRLLQVRDMLRRTALRDAVGAALHPRRASSYNNVLAHADGQVVNVEGSATDAELMGPSGGGTLAHTNHYVCERMLPYEGDAEYAPHSDVRYRRAMRLLDDAAPSGGITEADLRRMLADHANAPDSLCRHPADGATTVTVFWCTADVTVGRITFGRGRPCRSRAQTYRFERT